MDRNNECLITSTVGLQNHPVASNVRGEGESKGVRQRENKKKLGHELLGIVFCASAL